MSLYIKVIVLVNVCIRVTEGVVGGVPKSNQGTLCSHKRTKCSGGSRWYA